MSNYVQTTYFAPKDSLLTGNPAKLIKGADVDPELAAISAAIASKYDATNISSAPVLFNDGTVAAPGISFASDTNTGFYRIGADDLGIATGGVKRLEIASAGAVTITGPTNLTSGGQALALTGLVTGNASAAYLVFNDSGNTRQGYLGKADSTADILMESQTGGLKFYANSTLALTIGSTGNCTIAAPSSGTGLTVNGLASSSYTAQIVAANSTGNSNGAFVRAGTNSGDIAMQVNNAANTATYMQIVGDGSGKLGPTSALGLSWTAAGNLTQTGGATITGTLQVNGTTAAFGGAASGYVVSPNFSFQNTGATNLAVRDTTDSTEGLFRADSTGIIFGAASNHSLFIRTNNATVISVGTAGGVQFGAPTGGDKGAGTLNVAGNLYVNNVAVGTSSAVGANPTATVGTAAVNGSSANFMRADGAPAINLGMVPTWTGAHVFSAASGVPVTISAASSGQALSLPAGTTTKYPVLVNSGTNLTTPVAGAVENDGTTPYFTPFATCRGVLRTEFLQTISAAYTLTSQTAAQKLLNATSTGAITLPIGVYKFECSFSLTSLSGSSGAFGFAFGGTATRTESWWYYANKTAGLPGGNGSGADGFCTAANVAISPTNTLQTGYATIRGVIRVTVAGTLIPQVSLGVAAAAVVGTDSFFLIQPVGPSGFTTVGQWT